MPSSGAARSDLMRLGQLLREPGVGMPLRRGDHGEPAARGDVGGKNNAAIATKSGCIFLIEDPYRRDTAAPSCWGLAINDPFRQVSEALKGSYTENI